MKLKKLLAGCLVAALLLPLGYQTVDYNRMNIAKATAEEILQQESQAVYRLVEDFEGNGYISAKDPINAGAQFAYASRPEPVITGNQSGKLSYQFTGKNAGSAAAYMNFWNNSAKTDMLELEGKPDKLGVWVYGDGNNKHWLRAEFNDGKVSELTKSNEFNWRGWRYVVFDVPPELLMDDYRESVKLRRIYPVQTSDSNKSDGVIYFDQLTAFYGNTGGIYGLELSGLSPLKMGEKKQAMVLETKAGYAAPQRIQSQAMYASSDESVAVVSSAGEVTAKKAGTAVITASYGGFTASYELTVSTEEASIAKMLLEGPKEVNVKDEFQLALYASYINDPQWLEVKNGAVFSASPAGILSVDNSGKAVALKAGKAVIKAVYQGKTVEWTIQVSEQKKVLEQIQLMNIAALDIGAVQQLKVMGKYNGSSVLQEIAKGVSFTSSNSKVAAVDAQGKVKGVAVGAATITAVYEGKQTQYTVIVNKAGLKAPKRELRAAWIATVDRIDWPKTTGEKNQKQEFTELLDMHQQIGMNAVVMQIKPTADAFYPSEYAPWSHWLTGKQGQNPGYDPLQFMVEEAHKRNMEFHAWFNPYRVSVNNKLENLADNHPAKLHPDWVMEYEGKLYFDPGHPEVIDYITKSVMEVVGKYDIDAVHFDDYFYPNRFDGTGYPDQATYEKYGKRNYPKDINAWRRNNVDTLIKNLSSQIKQKKSYVKFGISPFGVWRNKNVDSNGSNTTAGQPSYDNLHADVRKWVLNGWIDYVTPQIYWNFGFKPAAYEELVKWWSDLIRVNRAKTHLYIGHADYKVNDNENFTNPNEIPEQMKFNWNFKEVAGSMHFTTRDLKNKQALRAAVSDMYRTKALVPEMTWLQTSSAAKPGISQLAHTPSLVLTSVPAVSLNWSDNDKNTAYYVIYRTSGKEKINADNPAHIRAIVRKQADFTLFTDVQVVKDGQYNYAVTAVDRLHKESKLSTVIEVEEGKAALSQTTATIEAGKSGIVQLEQKVIVTIPEQALSKAFEIKIEQMSDLSSLNLKGYKLLSPVFDITKNIAGNFKKNVQIKVAYDAAKLLAKEEAKLFYYDSKKKDWLLVGGTENGGYVTAEINHFTPFAVLAVEKEEFEPNGCKLVAFTDMKDHWAKSQVEEAVKLCIVAGYDDLTFRPENSVTREQFAAMVTRAFKLSASGKKLDFKDADEINSWAKEEVAAAVEAGIISGYTDGTFRPKASIKRSEAAVMAVKALGLKHNIGVSTLFADDHLIPAWAREYVQSAAANGIIAGKTGNLFMPADTTKRAEAAAILLRMVKLAQD